MDRDDLRARLLARLKPSRSGVAFDCPRCLETDALFVAVHLDRTAADPRYLASMAAFCACDAATILETLTTPILS